MPVSSIQFVPDHPLVISTGLCGTVCVHAVRGVPVAKEKVLMNVCLAKFVNLGGGGARPYINTGITSCAVLYKVFKQGEKGDVDAAHKNGNKDSVTMKAHREDMFRRAEHFPDDEPSQVQGYFQSDFKAQKNIVEYEPMWANAESL